ncbi:MAG TPA: HYR domain-containing protein, partial [Paludibacteraceae bacterium]|nr:HYR domain-containing protein [Paludibacteraceae bacterium]
YTLNGPLLFANMTLVGSQIDSIPDTTNAIFTVPISASVPAGLPLVVELFTPDGQAVGNSFYIGSNSNGQTDTTYLAAADCGITEPTDIAAIGFPGMQIILDINSIGSTTTQMISGLGSGATFPLGTTTEVYQSTDATGNVSVCDINIIVVDNEPPMFTCPSDITVNGGSDSIFAGAGCSTINGFTGVYDPSFWNFFQLNANGFADLSAVPDSITFFGGDNGSDSAGFTNCSIPINCVGTITFDWAYTAGDSALYDLPRYSLNGGATYTTLPGFSTSGPDHQTGTASIPVMDGQTFVINVYTTDNKYGPAVLVISDFAAPGMTMPVATDNCGVASVTSDHPSSTFPAGVNTVTWTVTDVNGNITTCEQTVTVNSTYSISEANVESVGLYPNPTNGDLTIDLSKGYEGTKIYLYSTEGKLIRMLNDGTKESKILCNLSDLAGGLYFLKFENQQAVFYKKVVKN